MAGYLVRVVAGASAGAVAEIQGGAITVGRDPSCDLVINDATVSRLHLRIADNGHYATVQDLDSTNGTMVNGARAVYVVVSPGDAIRVGDSELALEVQSYSYAQPATAGYAPSQKSDRSWLVGFAAVIFIAALVAGGIALYSMLPASGDSEVSRGTGIVRMPDHPASAAAGPPDLSDMVDALSPSVVQIFTPSGVGSGFVVDERDRVITNAHVVKRLATVGVRSSDGKTYRGTVLGVDEVADLALIRLEQGAGLKPAPLGDSDSIRVGADVIAMGFPLSGKLGDSMTVTRGIVSAKRSSGRSVKLIQTDAAVNPGNSGGPLIGPDGRVVGINTEKLFTSEDGRPVEGISIAVAINDARDMFDSLARGGTQDSGYGFLGLLG